MCRPWRARPMAAEKSLRGAVRGLARRCSQLCPLPVGTRTAIQRVFVCDVASQRAVLSLPETRLLTPQLSKPQHQQSDALDLPRHLKPLSTPYRTRAQRPAA